MKKKKASDLFDYDSKSVKKAINTLVGLEKVLDKAMSNVESKDIARIHYTELKVKLKTILKPGETIKGLAGLNDVERNFVVPACSEAFGRLTSPTNSHPIKSGWHSQLYSANVDIVFFRRQLDELLLKLDADE